MHFGIPMIHHQKAGNFRFPYHHFMRSGDGDPVTWVNETRNLFVGRTARGLTKRAVPIRPAPNSTLVRNPRAINVTKPAFTSAIVPGSAQGQAMRVATPRARGFFARIGDFFKRGRRV